MHDILGQKVSGSIKEKDYKLLPYSAAKMPCEPFKICNSSVLYQHTYNTVGILTCEVDLYGGSHWVKFLHTLTITNCLFIDFQYMEKSIVKSVKIFVMYINFVIQSQV